MRLQPLDGARAEHDHAVLPLAAQDLLPGPCRDIELVPGQPHGERGRGRVADRQTGAIVGDPRAIGNTHTRGRAIPCEDDIAVEIDGREIR